MNTRDALNEQGRNTRQKLGLARPAEAELAPGLEDLLTEAVYGRVWSRPGLGTEERMLATLASLSARQYLPALSTMVGAALDLAMPARKVQEVMLHAAMYAGMPTAVSSLGVVAEALAARSMPVPDDDLPRRDADALQSLGVDTMTALHAERSAAGYAAPDSAASGLYATAIDYLYGEIWNRPGISRRERMICSVAAFTALQMESQQKKFFRSALNVGLTRAEVLEVIIQTGPYSGFPPALNALAVAESVLG